MSTNQISSPLISIAAAQDGSAVAIDQNGNLYQAIPGAVPWSSIPISGVSSLAFISASSDGIVLGVINGMVYQLNEGTFQPAPTYGELPQGTIA
ncbi:MAG TPA: hypothetical protein VG477_11660, partial [Thermoanaerobaculia bacterium]|nr:hypothetical protein [Thermoanaerobaculia bacterium]